MPLLHGKITAKKLPARYPALPPDVFHAIAMHTSGEPSPSLESAVLYIADLIEPTRPAYESIQKIRSLVGRTDLMSLYIDAYKSTLMYLIENNKYVWPRSIEIFNELTNPLSSFRDNGFVD